MWPTSGSAYSVEAGVFVRARHVARKQNLHIENVSGTLLWNQCLCTKQFFTRLVWYLQQSM